MSAACLLGGLLLSELVHLFGACSGGLQALGQCAGGIGRQRKVRGERLLLERHDDVGGLVLAGVETGGAAEALQFCIAFEVRGVVMVLPVVAIGIHKGWRGGCGFSAHGWASPWCWQRKARAALGRAGWGVKAPVPALAGMPGEGEGGMAETLPRPCVEIEDGCRVRPGLFDGNGGSRLSRLAGGQLPVTICHQESLGAYFMAPL